MRRAEKRKYDDIIDSSEHTPNSQTRIEARYQSGDFLYGLFTPGGYLSNFANFLARSNPPHIVANDFYSPILTKMISPINSTALDNYVFKSDFLNLNIHRDYLLKSGGRPIESMKDSIRGVAHRRACKLLLIHSNASRQAHFDLNGIDMARVCNREANDLGVTNSELRALYRHTKEHGPNPHVLFYQKGVACPPPWEQKEYREHWQAYDEYRRKKQEAANNDPTPKAKRPKP